MRRYFLAASFFTLLMLTLLSCSNDAKRSAEEAKKDSLMLIYRPGKESKKIDEFVERLHRTRQFNGNVLVARRERSFTKEPSAGPITCIAIA